jgi:hypothetical protein
MLTLRRVFAIQFFFTFSPGYSLHADGVAVNHSLHAVNRNPLARRRHDRTANRNPRIKFNPNPGREACSVPSDALA